MANGEQVAILRQGVEKWNQWREQHPDAKIDLSGADIAGCNLVSVDLHGADVSSANLSRSDLTHADLRKANLAMSNLEGAVFLFADLAGCDLRGADLRHASLEDARMQGADLSQSCLDKATLAHANLEDVDLMLADLSSANLTGACLSNAKIASVKYDRHIFLKVLRETRFRPGEIWKRRNDLLLDTTILCKGIHAASCYGSQQFRLFLEDQDYLEEFMEGRLGKPTLLLWWLLADCGRSVLRWAAWSGLFALIYALLFLWLGPEHIHSAHLPINLMTMIYYSIVTFTTLGFGDVVPRTNVAALLLTMEVVTGYVMLGGLITIFSTKLARRSA